MFFNNINNIFNDSSYFNNEMNENDSFSRINVINFNSNSFGSNSQDYNDYNMEQPQSQPIYEIEKEPPLNQDDKKNLVLNNKLNENGNLYTNTKSTAEKTLSKIVISSPTKIFEIRKVKKKGRKKKYEIVYKDKIHTKLNKDNIITKIKRNVYNHCLKFVNLLLSKSKNYKLKGIKLHKNNNSIIIASKKEENLYLLDLPIKEILSNKLSNKYIYLHEDYNKDKINYILRQNDIELNDVLNKTFREMLYLYCQDNANDTTIFKDFKRLNDDLETFIKENEDEDEDEDYINEYKKITLEFEDVINSIFPRKKRKII